MPAHPLGFEKGSNASGAAGAVARLGNSVETESGPMNTAGEEFLTVEQLAWRLGWEPKTVRNKMGRIFKKGIHYAQAPGLPVLFKWSTVLELYDWKPEPVTSPALDTDRGLIPMARGYSMK
jgi:hypothetical protein